VHVVDVSLSHPIYAELGLSGNSVPVPEIPGNMDLTQYAGTVCDEFDI
jgi:hypothetical protein